MAGCLASFKRANSGLYGDAYGDICEEPGKRNITVDGGVILWIMNKDDIVIKKEDIESFEFDKTESNVNNMLSGGGKNYVVDIYNITMKNGKSGYFRIIKEVSWKDSNGQMRTKNLSANAELLLSKLR